MPPLVLFDCWLVTSLEGKKKEWPAQEVNAARNRWEDLFSGLGDWAWGLGLGVGVDKGHLINIAFNVERRSPANNTAGGREMKNWCFIAEKPAPAPHLAHPEGCAALRIVLVTVHRVSRSCEHFPDGFDLPLLQGGEGLTASRHVRIDREGVRDTDDPESMRVGQVPPAWSKVPSALSVERASKKAEYEEEVCSQDW